MDLCCICIRTSTATPRRRRRLRVVGLVYINHHQCAVCMCVRVHKCGCHTDVHSTHMRNIMHASVLCGAGGWRRYECCVEWCTRARCWCLWPSAINLRAFKCMHMRVELNATAHRVNELCLCHTLRTESRDSTKCCTIILTKYNKLGSSANKHRKTLLDCFFSLHIIRTINALRFPLGIPPKNDRP